MYCDLKVIQGLLDKVHGQRNSSRLNMGKLVTDQHNQLKLSTFLQNFISSSVSFVKVPYYLYFDLQLTKINFFSRCQ